MISRNEVQEDKARGLAVGQQWDGEGGSYRVITRMQAVTNKSDPWILIQHIDKDGRTIEGSGIEWFNWRERVKAKVTRTKGQT